MLSTPNCSDQQTGRAPAAKTGDLSLIPRIHMVEGENWPQNLSSVLLRHDMHITAHAQT